MNRIILVILIAGVLSFLPMFYCTLLPTVWAITSLLLPTYKFGGLFIFVGITVYYVAMCVLVALFMKTKLYKRMTSYE